MANDTHPAASLTDRLLDWSRLHWHVLQDTRNWPLPPTESPQVLKVQTLGVPLLELAGIPLQFPYQKVQDLLLYLVFHRRATVQQLQEDLWPEKSPECIYTGVRQLRRTLAAAGWPSEAVVKTQRHYTLSSDLTLQLDFEQLQGPFCDGRLNPVYLQNILEGLDAPWVDEIRHLISAALQKNLQLALQDGPPLQGLVLHLLLLRLDPYQDPVLQAALMLAQQLGQQGVQQVLETLQHALALGLEVEVLQDQLRQHILLLCPGNLP